MSSLELRGIAKNYGSLEIVHDFNLQIDDGSFTVFVGPSGCGKSTLMRMIAGLEDITGGDLVIDGKRVNDVDPIERGVAMVFQNYALYPHMTVEQNIGFSLKIAGLGKAEIAKKVESVASSLQIEPLLKRKPGQLSGGQRQRVAIGRAIVRDPNIFLFDEPLSNLDAELRVSMRVEIAKLHRRIGTTMIYVTHDQTEAMTLADRIVVLRGGKIEQVDTPQRIYDDPDNTFVAGFIGSPRMNFLSAKVHSGMASFPGLSNPLPIRSPDGDVQIGIRPEHFRIGEGQHALNMQVDVAENLGGTRYLYGSLEDGTPIVAEARDVPVKSGEVARLNFDPQRALVFAGDGNRLRGVN